MAREDEHAALIFLGDAIRRAGMIDPSGAVAARAAIDDPAIGQPEKNV